MKIANVALHSMKKDGARVLDWLRDRRPDIVTLQKVGSGEHFPTKDLREIGYESRFLGSRSRSDLGIAILSLRSLPHPDVCVRQLPGAKQEESRFLTVNIGGLWVSAIYAPYGPTVEWLNRLRDHVHSEGYERRNSVLCGDFNVKFRADGPRGTGYSQAEEDALEELMSLGFVDLYRAAHPDPKYAPGRTRGYSENFPAGTSRLHLILASGSLARCLQDARLDVCSRPRRDAPPLVVDLDGVRM